MAATLRTIAAACGVDVSTVSRALRGDKRVKAETTEKVRRTASRLGYQPNLAARRLQSGKSKTLWFVLPSLNVAIEREPAQFASEYCCQFGFDMLLALHNHQQNNILRLYERLWQKTADGAILLPSGKSHLRILQSLRDNGFPMVFLDRHFEELDTPVVTTDNAGAAAKLAEMCQNAGAVEYVSLFDEGNPVARDRGLGLLKAVRQNGGTLHNSDRGSLDLSHREGAVAILGSTQRRVLTFLERNMALFGNRKLLIACFDEWVGEPTPAVKVFTCHQDFKAMARAAVDLLLDIVNNGYDAHQKLIRVPPKSFTTVDKRFQ